MGLFTFQYAMKHSDFQWATSQREIARACFYASCPFIWPVKANGNNPDWLIPKDGVMYSTGCKTLQDVTLGTWMDMMRLVAKGQPHHADPLCRQVRSFLYHAGKRYKTTKFQ